MEISKAEAEEFEKIRHPIRRRGGFFRLRRGIDPGAPDVTVGEVNPDDPWAQIGAAETGGAIISGEDVDKSGIGIFPLKPGKGKKRK